MTLSARKRKRDDAALQLRRRRASNSSPPPPDYDQGLALEEMLEMVAAGQGEDTGATLQSLAAISLRMITVLREKQEIERGLAAMRMSRMQAAHSSEKRKTAELLRRREEENLALRLELETLRAQVLPEQEQDGSSTSSDSPSEFHFTLRTLDSSRDFNSVLEPFVRRWRKYEYCLMTFGQRLCTKKYVEIFPEWWVQDLCRLQENADRNEFGRLRGAGNSYAHFSNLVKHVWLLHQLGLSSSNSPPLTLLRVPYGTPFQKPLTPTADPIDHQPSYMHDLDHPFDADALPLVYESKTNGVPRQLLRALGPLSPSSPLAIHNGLLNQLGDPWYGQWTSARGLFFVDNSAAAVEHLEDITPKPRHTDVFIGPNGTFESATPGDWTPQLLFDRSEEVKVASIVPMASLREAGEVTSCADPREIGSLVDLGSKEDLSCVATNSSSAVTMAGMLADCHRRPQIADIDSTVTTTWPRKHRLELLELVDAEADQPLLKRAKTVKSVEETKLLQSWSNIQRYCPASGVARLASQAMDITAIGPALNTNGKPRARRSSATDPQSVYARHRREKTNGRLKNLQNLVPNGAKVDIVTMLDEAIHYVKFLQNQVELLKSDDYWMYATPNNYNGMDLSELSQELEPSA